MRVLVFLPSTAVGGSERMAVTLVNQLAQETPTRLAVGRQGPLTAELSPMVEVVPLEAGRARQAVVPLVRLIRAWRPDVVFAPKPEASLAVTLAWRLAGRRVALVLRESNHRTAQGLSRRSLFMRGLGWAYRQADLVVAPSAGVADDLRLRYGLAPSRIRTIHNPIDLVRIQRAGAGASDGRARGEQPETLSLMAVGRLVGQKGFDVLLRSLRMVHDRLPEPRLELTILGEGPERPHLERLVSALRLTDAVRLPGLVPNPYPALARADLFVLPSRWEGFPNALVEALALGVPAVASRCPAGPEEIIEHEHSGLLVEPNSPDALAEAILRVAADPSLRHQYAQAGPEQALRFEASRVAQAYLKVFVGLLEGRG